MYPEEPRGRRRILRLMGTAALAGASGALFSGFAAHAFGVSVTIASSVGGTLMALVVGLLIHRHDGRAT